MHISSGKNHPKFRMLLQKLSYFEQAYTSDRPHVNRAEEKDIHTQTIVVVELLICSVHVHVYVWRKYHVIDQT